MLQPTATLAVKPPSVTALLSSLLALIVVAVAGASQLQYSKQERVAGYLQPAGGEIRIHAPAAGTVALTVKAGDAVQLGQALATVRSADELLAGGSYRQARDQSRDERQVTVQRQLDDSQAAMQAQQRAIEARVRVIRGSAAQAEGEAATRVQQVALAEARLARQRELAAQGFVAATAVEALQADLLSAQAQLQSAQRAVSTAHGEVSSLQTDMGALLAQRSATTGQLQRELQGLGQDALDLQRQEGLVATAPGAARVTAVAAAQGDSVTAGQLLFKLAREGAPLEATLLLPATSAGRVRVGQLVTIEMTAFPYQTYGHVQAQIDQLDTAPLLAGEASMLRSNGAPDNAVVLRATARIVDVPAAIGGARALSPGMQFQAAVEVERKSFLAWMTGPLLKHFR